MEKHRLNKVFLVALLSSFVFTGNADAALEWQLQKTVPLTEGALDVVEAIDGKRFYILTRKGTILVLNSSGSIESTLEGPFEAKHLRVSREGNKLFLIGEGPKGLQIIKLNDRYEIEMANSPVKGNPDAPIAVVVFSDFQCPYCSAINPILNQLIEKYPEKVKLVFKNFPLPIHNAAIPAAQAALAAHRQGKFWAYHDTLFSSYKVMDDFQDLNENKLIQFAIEIGLDLEEFNKDLKNPKLAKVIKSDLQLGEAIGVRATPTIFVNGLMLKNRSFEDASNLIESELLRLENK